MATKLTYDKTGPFLV